MASVYGDLVRRGLDAVSAPAAGSREQHIEMLRKQAQLYKDTPQASVQPWQLVIVGLTAIAFFVILVSMQYTIDEVIFSLAMVEQPRTLLLAEGKRFDSEDSDATLEKAPLIDEEVTTFREQPVTRSIKSAVQHLQRVGGFRARYRGLGAAIVYSIAHSMATYLLALLVFALVVEPQLALVLGSISASVLLARLRMTWTHIKISQPSALSFFKRMPNDRTHFKLLALPALLRAVSNQLFALLPIGVWYTMPGGTQQMETCRILAVFATYVFVGLAVALPAAVTLTRVEASLLPEDQDTIVSFDRTLGNATTSTEHTGRVNPRAVFIAAWRSFDRASRIRLLKLFAEAAGIYILCIAAFGVLIAAELYSIGPEALKAYVVSNSAQLRLMQMGVSDY